MKISLLKKNSRNEIVNTPRTETIEILRDRILNSVLIGATILGIIVYFLVVIRSFAQTPIPAFIVYTIATLWIMVVTFWRRFPYRIRAISVVGLIYLLGVTSYLQGGITTDGAIFILAFISMTGVLFGSRGTIYAFIIGIFSAILIGVLMSLHIVAPSTPFTSDDPNGWINRGAVLIMLCIVIGLSLTTLIKGLQRNLNKATEIANELGKGQEDLRFRSQELERRTAEIRTAAEISRSIGGMLAPKKLLSETATLILERLNLYYVGIFMVDESTRYAVLQVGTGEAGKSMVATHHKLPIGESSMVGWAISHRQARIALDVGKEPIRFANPLLPNTHSELALPLISKDRSIGAITIQSEKPDAFDQEDILILQSIADTLAVGYENAVLFEETQKSLDEMRVSQKDYVNRAWSDKSRTEEEYEYAGSSEDFRSDNAISAIDVPLILREQIIGQLHLEGQQDWSPEEHALVEAVATQAALAMENARLLEESRQLALRERLAAEITSKVWSSPNVELILQTAIAELSKALHADEATIELKMD